MQFIIDIYFLYTTDGSLLVVVAIAAELCASLAAHVPAHGVVVVEELTVDRSNLIASLGIDDDVVHVLLRLGSGCLMHVRLLASTVLVGGLIKSTPPRGLPPPGVATIEEMQTIGETAVKLLL